MKSTTRIHTDILMIGGGHAHALVLRQWAMQPPPGVRLTLISRDVLTPYSGMLPGLIAGHYTSGDVHIDLDRLCSWANVRFIEATMTGIDLAQRCVLLDGRPPVYFDVLSLDTGSTPDLGISGAGQFTTPVKPVHTFHERWLNIRQRVDEAADGLRIGIVGSGAGGYEILMAMQFALTESRCEFHWFLRGEHPIGGRAPGVGDAAKASAIAAGIHVHTGFDVDEVTDKGLAAADGREIELDEVVWCTAASAPDWVKEAGLVTDERGFVATNRYLQSVSHPFVFATGDIGTQQETPNAKAGVFAVRQAPVLHHNLQRLVAGRSLRVFTPQQRFLSLMATGEQAAIASWGPFTLTGRWVWRWKDWIDQQFMQRFVDLPSEHEMTPRVSMSFRPWVDPAVRTQSQQVAMYPTFSGSASKRDSSVDQRQSLPATVMPCSGCGAKVASLILDEVLDELRHGEHSATGIVQGLDARDDVAVFTSEGAAVVQSVDQLREIIADPYIFGEVAAKHALSDIFTTASSPHSAQVTVTVPFAEPHIIKRDLALLMAGVVKALNEARCTLLGGHSNEGLECQLGLVVNATMPEPMVTPAATVGDHLILTDALGIGVLFAARMQNRASGVDVREAIRVMRQSNQAAARILQRFGARCMTDVTGFGLLGHLQRLLAEFAVTAHIDIAAVPMLPGVEALATQGVCSTLWPHNMAAAESGYWDNLAELSQAERFILADPQTSGGLLAVVPADQANECLRELQAAGYGRASGIGVLVEEERHRIIRETRFQGLENDDNLTPLASPGGTIR